VVAAHDEHRILIIETVKFCPEEREGADIHAASPGPDLLDAYVARSLADWRKVADVQCCRSRWVHLLVSRLGIPYDDGPEDLVPPHYIVKGASKGRDVHPPGNTHRDLLCEPRVEGPGFIAKIPGAPPLLRT
jgi:hypothetical protein